MYVQYATGRAALLQGAWRGAVDCLGAMAALAQTEKADCRPAPVRKSPRASSRFFSGALSTPIHGLPGIAPWEGCSKAHGAILSGCRERRADDAAP